MKSSIHIIILGEPVAKGRARGKIITTRAKQQFISWYTPAETVAYERRIQSAAKNAMKGMPPLDVSCEVIAVAYIGVPKSYSKKKTILCLAQSLYPQSSPDSDNYLKAACDGLNGIVFTDDSRVWRMVVEKRYSDNPRLEIIINTKEDL